jgi:transcriptional regulator with GAF, ATPase, and Fis domain
MLQLCDNGVGERSESPHPSMIGGVARARRIEDPAEPEMRRLGRRIVGASRALRAVLSSIIRVAPTPAPVLLLGETGTGKELFAWAVHDLSLRTAGPLVRVDCASLTPTLSESELFGHLRGAFTGALNRRAGRIELAHQGTLFLDEIGELPLEHQAKFLRVLQEGEFEALGASRTTKVDIRVVAATNRPLADEVRAGRFRADLYHRLAAFPIHIPPLRDRLEDLPALVAHMLGRQSEILGRCFQPVAPSLIEALRRHTWPGNVRELQNAVQRACILAPGSILALADFWVPGLIPNSPPQPRPATKASPALQTLREVERAHICAVLDHCGGAVEGRAGAAAVLGLAPSTLRFRIRKLGIETANRQTRPAPVPNCSHRGQQERTQDSVNHSEA